MNGQKTSPPHGGSEPYPRHQYTGPSQLQPEMAARLLHALLHKCATKSPLVTMGHPSSTPKLTLLVEGTPPQPDVALPWGPVQPQYTTQTD